MRHCFFKRHGKAKACLTILAAALVFLSGMSVRAHVGDRVYPVAYLSDEMLEEIRLDDGSVDEWYELVGDPAMTLLDFRETLEGSIPDPSNLDFRIWLAWHDDPPRFYVAFVASDDVYKNNHDYNVTDYSGRALIQRSDSIILGIDGDHSGGNDASGMKLEGWEELSGQTQYYEAIARTPSGPTLDDPGTRVQTGEFAWTALPPYGEGGGGVAGEAPVISVIELYITPFDRWAGWHSPGEVVVSDLTAGQIIGFAIGVHDFDSPGWEILIPEATQAQPDSDGFEIMSLFADRFPDGVLLPGETGGPGDSAVESVSWGRIKAALEID